MTTKNSLASWLDMARHALAEVSSEPSIEAQALITRQMGCSRAWLFAHMDEIIEDEQEAAFNALLARRIAGEPLPYLLGSWDFYGMEFLVTPAVLIPRPETEQMVDLAREWLVSNPPPRRVVDVGTGSGCISVALLSWIKHLEITAIDISHDALAVAQKNLAKHGLLDRCTLVQSDLLSSLQGPFDLICANLPYIPSQTVDALPVAKFEPRLALDGGTDGLRLIQRLLQQADGHMLPGGRIILEIEFSQGDDAVHLASTCFPQAKVVLHEDLAGLPRVVVIDLPA